MENDIPPAKAISLFIKIWPALKVEIDIKYVKKLITNKDPIKYAIKYAKAS